MSYQVIVHKLQSLKSNIECAEIYILYEHANIPQKFVSKNLPLPQLSGTADR